MEKNGEYQEQMVKKADNEYSQDETFQAALDRLNKDNSEKNLEEPNECK